MKKLAPSLLSADFSKLGEEVARIENAGADLIHIDVMDGHFVPNISYGAPVIKSLIGKTKMPFDVHLMIEDADKYISDFVTENTEYITVHQEACTHLDRTIQLIKSYDIKAGVAINPATPLATLEYVLNEIDLALVMSVNPGFGGQKFIAESLRKITRLAEVRAKRNLSFEIAVDGGINTENAQLVSEAGADILVAGAAVFKADDIERKVKEFTRLLHS